MKYWIFQNNQVLGPYGPDEMSRISVFSPESLVCPEGRGGTSMGDWQRAGMVPDLAAALVRMAGAGGGRIAALSAADAAPETTPKDLIQIGSIQEKVAVLEQAVLRLQERLRGKDAELASLSRELAGKSRADGEAAHHDEVAELKRQIAGLEERLTSMRQLGETLDKAVEEEKRVEQDVEKQGRALTDLAREMEDLRRQLDESKARRIEPPPPAAAPAVPRPVPAESPAVGAESATPFGGPSLDAPASAAPPAPLAEMHPFVAPDPLLETQPFAAAPAALVEAQPFIAPPPPPAPKGNKTAMIGAALGLAALGGLAFMGGLIPGPRKPRAPVAALEPVAPPPPPEPAPVAAPDPRELAIQFVKAWTTPKGRVLGRALEELAPSAGNLSPWMADPLAGGRVQVNYFARSSAPGAPTIAYEFEVDLGEKTLVGRNAAAKSVLSGKATAPPKPPKSRPVRVKPKPSAAKRAPEGDALDAMLGGVPAGSAAQGADQEPTMPGVDAPPAAPVPARRAAKARGEAQADDETLLDDLLKE